MKIKELRIGNYIQTVDGDKCIVNSLSENINGVCINGVDISKYKPIIIEIDNLRQIGCINDGMHNDTYILELRTFRFIPKDPTLKIYFYCRDGKVVAPIKLALSIRLCKYRTTGIDS